MRDLGPRLTSELQYTELDFAKVFLLSMSLYFYLESDPNNNIIIVFLLLLI